MTNKEAVTILNSIKMFFCNEKGKPISDEYTAIDKAVKLLEQMPDEHGDLIDANVLIDRVNKEKAPIWWKELITEWIDKQPTVIAAERLTEDDDGYLPQSDWWDF